MKQILLAALLAAVAASSLTLLLTAGTRREPAPTTAAEFKSALADLVGEVAALRREMSAGRGVTAVPAPAPATVGAAPSSGPETPVAVEDPATLVPAGEEAPAPDALVVEVAEEMPPVREERSAIARSAELVEKLRDLTRWEESADVRRVWILASEETVVSAFGKPDDIWIQDSGQECWNYRTQTGTRDEDGEPEWQDIMLLMNRGRLVRADM